MSVGGSNAKGLSGSDTTTHANQTQNTQQSQQQSYTPNNLAPMQVGWNAADHIIGTDWNPWINNITSGLSSEATGANNATGLNSAAGGTATNFANGNYVNSNPADGYLTPFASGSYVGTQNPQFQQLVSQIGASLQPEIDGSYGAAGRYGSGANANAFASALTNAAGQLGYQNYTTQQGNQIRAADIIGNNNLTARQQQLAGAGIVPSLVSSNLQPGQALTTQGMSLPAMYQSLVTMGNAGGTGQGLNSGTNNMTGNSDTNNLSWFMNGESHGGFGFGNN